MKAHFFFHLFSLSLSFVRCSERCSEEKKKKSFYLSSRVNASIYRRVSAVGYNFPLSLVFYFFFLLIPLAKVPPSLNGLSLKLRKEEDNVHSWLVFLYIRKRALCTTLTLFFFTKAYTPIL